MRTLTVQEKIMLHLSQYTSYRDKIAVPSAITQEGIADAVGVKRPHISVDIKRMKEKGLIAEFKAHAGGRKKRKAYYLTQEGQRKLNEITENLRKRRVKLSLDDMNRELDGEQAADYLVRSMGLPYATAVEIVMEAQTITEEQIDKKKERREKTVYSSPLPEVPEIIGREEELERIERWYKSKSVCLSVVGTAGIGKSALVASFVSRLRSPVFWHSIQEWESLNYLLMDLADFLTKNGRPVLKDYLSSSKLDLGNIGRIFQNIDERQIWVFDDYQKAPESMRSFFEMLLHALKSTPVRVIVISRSIPSFYSRGDVSIKKSVHELFIYGLSMEAARELLVRKGLYVGEPVFREIYDFTGGHPLTLELIALSGLKKAAARAYLSEEFYRNLSQKERRMLSEVSVHRKPVLPEAFVKIEKDVETLKSLIRKGVVYYDTEERYFTHDIVKSLFKEKGKQRREHMLAYKYYEIKDNIDDKIEAVYHMLMAESYEKAEKMALEIADEAIIKGRGNELLSALNAKESDLPGIMLVKGKAMQATGRLKEAERIAKRVMRSFKGEEKIRAMCLLSLIYITEGRLEESIKVLEKAIKKAEKDEMKGEIRYNLGTAYIRMGKYRKAEKELAEAMEIYGKIGDYIKKERVRAQYASVLAGDGKIKEAISVLKNAAEFFEERRDYRVLGTIYNNMGMYQAKMEMRIESIESFEKAALYGELTGHMQLLAYALMNNANNYMVLGDATKAMESAEKARKIMEKMGDIRGIAILKTVIAEIHEIMGDDAEKYYEDAEKSLMDLGLKKHLGEMYMERGDLSKDDEKKMIFYRKAMEIFKEIGYEGGIKKIAEKSDGKVS